MIQSHFFDDVSLLLSYNYYGFLGKGREKNPIVSTVVLATIARDTNIFHVPLNSKHNIIIYTIESNE